MPASKCDCGCGHRPAAAGNKMRPVVCDSCGCTARYSRQWLSRMPGCPPCPVCGSEMSFPCLYDLILVDEEEARGHKRYGLCVLGIAKSAPMLKGNGAQHQCGGCGVFIPSVNHACQCGFENAIRGHRNDGRHVTGAAFCAESKQRDAIPF